MKRVLKATRIKAVFSTKESEADQAERHSMKKEAWKRRIKKACQEAGTYRPYFESVITSLSEILESRDAVRKYYIDSGADPIVMRTNKGGYTNVEKNPILAVYDDMNNTALIYWKELGLTPKGLKAIDDKAMKSNKPKSSLGDILKNLEG